MTERPILFSGEMVKAILAARKTQTRRIVKHYRWHYKDGSKSERREIYHSGHIIDWEMQAMIPSCPYGAAGDRLWVRETWGVGQHTKTGPEVWYKATEDRCAPLWKPSIHMPRAYSRLTLEVCSVHVERLQDISGADAQAEGISYLHCYGPGCLDGPDGCNARGCIGARDGYRQLWEKINGAGSWEANPWVWVVTFKALNGGGARAAIQKAEGGTE